MRQHLYVMLLAVSVTFVMGSPLREARSPEPRGGGGGAGGAKGGGGGGGGRGGSSGGIRSGGVTYVAKDDGYGRTFMTPTTAIVDGKEYAGALPKGNTVGYLCFSYEPDGRLLACRESRLKRRHTTAEKRMGVPVEEKYTPKSKEEGQIAVKRLKEELETISRAVNGTQCDYAIELQIIDLVLMENSFCSTLDSLVAIAEPDEDKQSDLRAKLMQGAVHAALDVDNMWAVEKTVFQDKLKLTSEVIAGKQTRFVETDSDAKKTPDKGLLEYLEKAENSVIRTAYKFDAEIRRVLKEVEKKANKRADDDEGKKKKIQDSMKKMNGVPETIQVGIKKYYRDSMIAAGHKEKLAKSTYVEGEDMDEKVMDKGKGGNDKSDTESRNEKKE